MKKLLLGALVLLFIAVPLFAGGQGEQAGEPAQKECSHRGELDTMYCDENKDLVADTPEKTVNPDVLFFTYTPLEDPAVYIDMFRPFLDHLEEVTGKDIRYFTAQSYAAQIEAMRSGRLHIAGISTGPTCFAVNLAGYVPFSIMGTDEGEYGYRLQTITHVDSDITSLEDLEGKTVAHTEESSNSGNQAPRALLPEEGVVPGEDYEVTYSGGHGPSILGVYNKDYPAAHIASSVLDRMADRGEVEMDDLRIIFESDAFPTTSFGYAHNLAPELKEKIEEAFFSYEFAGTPLGEEFTDVDKFIPVSYKKAWKPIRTIQEYNGVEYTREGLEE
jgi:phosphonate transport system substrate-binding protein